MWWAPMGSLVFRRISQDLMHPVFVSSNRGPCASAGGSGTVATLCGEVWCPLEHGMGCLGFSCLVWGFTRTPVGSCWGGDRS